MILCLRKSYSVLDSIYFDFARRLASLMTVIAMTRQLGCLGTEVANGVAGRLGLKIIHSEIVANNVAERLGIGEGAVLRYVDGSASLFERWAIDKRKLSRYTTEEILSLAQQGEVLIRGWGAATLLR